MFYALLPMYVLFHKIKGNLRNEEMQSYQRRHGKTTEINFTRNYIRNKISKNHHSGDGL